MQRLHGDDPETIGPYRLIARLGSGGMGSVFLGQDGTQQAAIKVVRSGFFDDPSSRTRFQREVETLDKLESPYVAKLLAADVDSDLVWHAVEYIHGPTLKEKVELDGPLDNSSWMLLAQELELVLKDLSRAGVIHRDLKPSNVVMSEVGIKLIDFGIAIDGDSTSVTRTGMVTGSPAWLSPEQIDGAEVSSATDLFSAGSLLVFAATGHSPWGDTTSTSASEIIGRLIGHRPRLDNLLPEQRQVVEGLLHPTPALRRWNLPEGVEALAEPPAVATSSKLPTNTVHASQTESKPKMRNSDSLTRALRWPTIIWVVGMFIFGFSPSSIAALVTVTLWLVSYVWTVIRVVRLFSRPGRFAVWGAFFVAFFGWPIVTLIAMVIVSVIFW